MSARDHDSDQPRLLRQPGEIASWSQTCDYCDHSRADHIADPRAVNSLHAISDCNVVVVKSEWETDDDGNKLKKTSTSTDCDCEVFKLD